MRIPTSNGLIRRVMHPRHREASYSMIPLEPLTPTHKRPSISQPPSYARPLTLSKLEGERQYRATLEKYRRRSVVWLKAKFPAFIQSMTMPPMPVSAPMVM